MGKSLFMPDQKLIQSSKFIFWAGTKWFGAVIDAITFLVTQKSFWLEQLILEHYENKSTKTFRPTGILHIFTKF